MHVCCPTVVGFVFSAGRAINGLSKVICVVQYQQYRSPLQQMVTATRSAMLGLLRVRPVLVQQWDVGFDDL